MAAFHFEETSAPINWPRIAATNVRQLQKLGDVHSLRGFLADVCVGDADDGFVSYDTETERLERKALRVNQLTTQYLLYSQQVLEQQTATLNRGKARLRKREAKDKRRYSVRKEKLRILEDEIARQDRLIATHTAVLQSVAPDVARRVAQRDDGRIVVLSPDDPSLRARERPSSPAPSYHDGYTDSDPGSDDGGLETGALRPPTAALSPRREPDEVRPRRPMSLLSLSRGGSVAGSLAPTVDASYDAPNPCIVGLHSPMVSVVDDDATTRL